MDLKMAGFLDPVSLTVILLNAMIKPSLVISKSSCGIFTIKRSSKTLAEVSIEMVRSIMMPSFKTFT